jgi:two-component system CitB family sensor kinase
VDEAAGGGAEFTVVLPEALTESVAEEPVAAYTVAEEESR